MVDQDRQECCGFFISPALCVLAFGGNGTMVVWYDLDLGDGWRNKNSPSELDALMIQLGVTQYHST